MAKIVKIGDKEISNEGYDHAMAQEAERIAAKARKIGEERVASHKIEQERKGDMN